jgi:cytochrome c oxidase assembly protein subunit 15
LRSSSSLVLGWRPGARWRLPGLRGTGNLALALLAQALFTGVATVFLSFPLAIAVLA